MKQLHLLQNIKKILSFSPVLAILFSLFLLFGRSYELTNSWSMIFDSPSAFIKSITLLLLFYVISSIIIFFFYRILNMNFSIKSNHFFSFLFDHYNILKCFIFIFICWLPLIITCYPGGFCPDSSWSLNQVFCSTYTTHQPLFYSLFIGIIVKFGGGFLNSYNLVLFLFIICQSITLALIFSYSLYKLFSYHISSTVLFCLLLFYCFLPVYSNSATMVIKDSLFSGFFLLYIIFLNDLLQNPQYYFRKTSFVIYYILISISISMLRNNGIYVLILTSIPLIFFAWKQKCKTAILFLLTPIILYLIIFRTTVVYLQADKGPIREMLSVPVQQTARYLRDYPADVTSKQVTVLKEVFNDYDNLGNLYNPNISDPTKETFIKYPTTNQLIKYTQTWILMFFQHPDSYLQAFLNHVYGWFYPISTNAVRYDSLTPDLFYVPESLISAHQFNYNYFTFANHSILLSIIESVGTYVWILLMLCSYIYKKKQGKSFLLVLPLLISLLICCVAPAFYGHPRFGFPIIFATPFVSMVIQTFSNRT